MIFETLQDLADTVRVGFAGESVAPKLQEEAIANLLRWMEEPGFAAHRSQLQALVAAERWPTLLDSFYRDLPFGTGGRRGRVGLGPNRFNHWTLGVSVQGHAAFLRCRSEITKELGEQPKPL